MCSKNSEHEKIRAITEASMEDLGHGKGAGNSRCRNVCGQRWRGKTVIGLVHFDQNGVVRWKTS